MSYINCASISLGGEGGGALFHPTEMTSDFVSVRGTQPGRQPAGWRSENVQQVRCILGP